ncbi:hypothetical protein [Tuwongella immobilis]|uniref:Uncharacterized protein n=1 Tax=Tuwongella immobilis TaxID=692036 RepID=A0A6C2YVP2_9BACT|nr:hypothetical protein [Tuwongella immobilis]VIP05437.1 unnamed protein product [Tuwongella immobilis]VTS08230.1 unnamed protein product [Tuwongella immobilis]
MSMRNWKRIRCRCWVAGILLGMIAGCGGAEPTYPKIESKIPTGPRVPPPPGKTVR